MPQTPDSATTPYCTAAQMLLCYARSLVADVLRQTENSPPPSYLAMLDDTNPAGIKLLYHMGVGAGEIEAACLVANRYTPADLQALTGVSLTLLQKLNAARAMWSLSQNLKPMTARPEEIPMARESAEFLRELRDGEMIFGFVESAEAGQPSVVPAAPEKLLTPNVVQRANRLFPNSQLGQRLYGGGD